MNRTPILLTALLLTTVPFVQATDLPNLGDAPASYSLEDPTPPEDSGSHLTVFFQLADPQVLQPLVTVDTMEGDRVLVVFGTGIDVFATDGARSDGTIRTEAVARNHLEFRWHRIDLTLEGASYTVSLDGGAPVQLRTFSQAHEGRLGAAPDDFIAPGYPAPERYEARWDSTDGSQELTFRDGPSDHGWSTVDTEGDRILLWPDRRGQFSQSGTLEIESEVLPGVAYIARDVPAIDGRYVAEASGQVENTIRPPIGQAVLAGISGPGSSPTVHWAILFDAVGPEPYTFGYALLGPDGSKTPVGGPWNTATPHHVRLVVDEPADRLEVSVDFAAEAFVFQGLGLDTSTKVAVGDLAPGLALAGLGGADASYDEVSVYPAP